MSDTLSLREAEQMQPLEPRDTLWAKRPGLPVARASAPKVSTCLLRFKKVQRQI